MKHAVLSPSGAHRWMRCPGSAVLEAALPDTSSVYADEGTAAHQLASLCLVQHEQAADHIGLKIRVGKNEFVVDKEMAGHVQGFVDRVRKLAEGRQLFVDQKLPIGHLTGEKDATGTGDVVIVDAAARALWSIDFKYGAGVKVSARENEQTRIYGLGALNKFNLLVDFDQIMCGIDQPRMDHDDGENLSTKALLEFGGTVEKAALVAHEAEKRAKEGATPGQLHAEGYLIPGPKQCQWCKAKATCPAARAEVMEITTGSASAADFADLIVADAQLGDNFLTTAMGAVDRIEDWCRAIRGEVERRLLNGQPVPGYKLVTGKEGNRAWLDAEKAAEALKAQKLKVSEVYTSTVISPTAAEKLLKKTRPSAWEAVQPHIHRSPGKPSVAPATDPRPALAIKPVADELRALNTE